MSTADPQPARADTAASGSLEPWGTGDLPPPPGGGWRLWVGMLGPGVVIAGTSVGTGEWLAGPAMTAQYGGVLLWLATVSIVMQVFTNLVVMRYALYCGEPLLVGIMRLRPGPKFWIACLVLLDFAAIWPYNAQNAAVPLAAAVLGHLPAGPSDVRLVKIIGYMIYFGAFVPLIFGGTVYKMLEKVIAIKLIYVLGFLTIVVAFMVSGTVLWE